MSANNVPPPPDLAHLLNDGPVSLFVDFDGTLVEIAPTPDGITVPPDLSQRLAALAERLQGRVALVSGRAIQDLENHLGPLAIASAGSHGSDCRSAEGVRVGSAPRALSADALTEFAEFAQSQGFAREDKPHGAALHYRGDPSLEEPGLAFAKNFAERHGLQVKRGKYVIELVGRGVGKASAVQTLMQIEPFVGSMPVFIGDDVTDEDGMRAATEMGGFGIAVGERPSENARYALDSTAAVQQWLDL
ncbi:MAG: trehalose-phosphatase [Erythrobacter sp.]|nr:MAG: trehalose-phosphatase [Erythrobacter sp.]